MTGGQYDMGATVQNVGPPCDLAIRVLAVLDSHDRKIPYRLRSSPPATTHPLRVDHGGVVSTDAIIPPYCPDPGPGALTLSLQIGNTRIDAATGVTPTSCTDTGKRPQATTLTFSTPTVTQTGSKSPA